MPALLVSVAHLADGNQPEHADKRRMQARIWKDKLAERMASYENGSNGIACVLSADVNEPLTTTANFTAVGGAIKELQDGLDVVSAYAANEPAVTAVWGTSVATFDFILHSKRLESIATLPMPTVDEVLSSGPYAVPSLGYPSDHIAIAARLATS
jgi:hypothetical protein